jgi:hypothetical protein
MINLVLLALCLTAILFISTSVITETLVLKAFKWGNIWQSLRLTFVIKIVSSSVIICGLFGEGAISTGEPIISINKISTQEAIAPQIQLQQNDVPYMESQQPILQEPIVLSTTWNIQAFVIIVIVESIILFIAGMRRGFWKLTDNSTQNSNGALRWKSLLQAVLISFCANTANLIAFLACRASSVFW